MTVLLRGLNFGKRSRKLAGGNVWDPVGLDKMRGAMSQCAILCDILRGCVILCENYAIVFDLQTEFIRWGRIQFQCQLKKKNANTQHLVPGLRREGIIGTLGAESESRLERLLCMSGVRCRNIFLNFGLVGSRLRCFCSTGP